MEPAINWKARVSNETRSDIDIYFETIFNKLAFARKHKFSETCSIIASSEEEIWHELAYKEIESLKVDSLPILKGLYHKNKHGYEKASASGDREEFREKMIRVERMIKFVLSPRSIIPKYFKEKLYERLEIVRTFVKSSITYNNLVSINSTQNVVEPSNEHYEGIVVNCSYKALSTNDYINKLQEMSMRLLVPADYPLSSPTILDEFPELYDNDRRDFLPRTVSELAKIWDKNSRAIVLEIAEDNSG
ncbi:hypothetical protein ACFE04_016603 [Oxalis oulophora]